MLIGLAGVRTVVADVSVPAVFSDFMVLQRGMEVPVWGKAEAGEKVTVSFGGKEVSTEAGADGKWMVKLPAMEASAEGRELVVAGKNRLGIQDVLVGDVWMCSGQSNMEWSMGACDAAEDIAAADFPAIRRIKAGHVSLSRPTDVVPGKWEKCTPQSARGFTAVGFYFARKVHQEVGVPVGILDCNWGGTRIEPWTAPEGFAMVESLKGMAEEMKKREAAYRAEMGKRLDEVEAWIGKVREAVKTEDGEIPPQPQIPGNPAAGSGSPMALYNGMVHPMVPFGIKGALWYQGESNGGEGDEYFEKMRALVLGWRKVWGQGEFPFYFVQLANHEQPTDDPAGGNGWARHRMAQLRAMKEIPKAGMAVIIDVGEAGDIHPKNKFDVGERLARWALNRDYGKTDVVVSGPIFDSASVEGDKVRVKFMAESLGGGLMVGKKEGRKPTEGVKDGKLERFAVAGEDKKWVWAEAVIDGDSVVVSSPQVAAPVAVRYAYSMNPAGANLYNKEGLPASPFRTDGW